MSMLPSPFTWIASGGEKGGHIDPTTRNTSTIQDHPQVIFANKLRVTTRRARTSPTHSKPVPNKAPEERVDGRMTCTEPATMVFRVDPDTGATPPTRCHTTAIMTLHAKGEILWWMVRTTQNKLDTKSNRQPCSFARESG
jgi:hypothetical protein